MEIRYFAHSWLSDWNHGNAHFLRGLASALTRRGHRVRCYEDVADGGGGWSLRHLLEERGGAAAVARMRRAYPELDLRLYGARRTPPSPALAGLTWVGDWDTELRGAGLVIAHEWNPPELFSWLLQQRRRHGFRLLLHDTHHRALSQPHALAGPWLRELDGVLAFGECLRRWYEREAGVRRSYTLHEAADVERFSPGSAVARCDLVWIGNWGDEERTRELEEFLLAPARELARTGAVTVVRGVRYPAEARARLRASRIAYRGYLPNIEVPRLYARSRVTVHVPRRYYASALPGIPTIRVFEALACGMPLVCSPWRDSETLFHPGEDFWIAADGGEMRRMLMQLLQDEGQRTKLGRNGAAAVCARHTCAHRALELEAICRDLDSSSTSLAPA